MEDAVAVALEREAKVAGMPGLTPSPYCLGRADCHRCQTARFLLLERFACLPEKYTQNDLVLLALTIPLTSYVEKNNVINDKINIYKMEEINNWNIVRKTIFEIFGASPGKLEHINKTENREEIILTVEQKERIYNIYSKDFINFDYKK